MAFNCWKDIKHLKMHNLLSAPAHSARNIRQPYVFGSYVTADYLTLHEHWLLPPVAATKTCSQACHWMLQAPWSGLCLHSKGIVSPQPMSKTTPYTLIMPSPLWTERAKSNFDEFSLALNIWITLLKYSRAPDAIYPVVRVESCKPHT